MRRREEERREGRTFFSREEEIVVTHFSRRFYFYLFFFLIFSGTKGGFWTMPAEVKQVSVAVPAGLLSSYLHPLLTLLVFLLLLTDSSLFGFCCVPLILFCFFILERYVFNVSFLTYPV